MSPDRLAPAAPAELAPQDVVLRFLESTGRPSEARLYIDLFHARPREQFAAIAIDANVMAYAADAVVQDLKFLAALDLFPTVVLGLFQTADAARHSRTLLHHLEAEGVRAEEWSAATPGLAGRLATCVQRGAIPVVVFEPPRRAGGRGGVAFPFSCGEQGGLASSEAAIRQQPLLEEAGRAPGNHEHLLTGSGIGVPPRERRVVVRAAGPRTLPAIPVSGPGADDPADGT